MGYIYKSSMDEKLAIEQTKIQNEEPAAMNTHVNSDEVQYTATQSIAPSIPRNTIIGITDNGPVSIPDKEADEPADVVEPSTEPDTPDAPLSAPTENPDAQSKVTLIELTEVYIDTIDEANAYVSNEIRRAREMENVMAGESGGRVGDLIEATANYIKMYRQHYITTQSLIGDLLTATKANLNTYKYTDVNEITDIDSIIANTQSATLAIAQKLVVYQKDSEVLDDYYTRYCEVKEEYLQEQCELID